MSKTSKTSSKEVSTQSVAEIQAAKFKLQTLVADMKTAGTLIGKYMAKKEKLKGELVDALTATLKSAMENDGLEVSMLKAPAKDKPSPLYSALVDSIAKARGVAWDDSNKAVRDNYMSKIRSYVKDRGANPLDLFGNLATKKAKEDAALSATTSANVSPANNTLSPVVSASSPVVSETPATPSQEPAASEPASTVVSFTAKDAQPIKEADLKGLPALSNYLLKWMDANPVMPAKYLEMAKAFQEEIAKSIPKVA